MKPTILVIVDLTTYVPVVVTFPARENAPELTIPGRSFFVAAWAASVWIVNETEEPIARDGECCGESRDDGRGDIRPFEGFDLDHMLPGDAGKQPQFYSRPTARFTRFSRTSCYRERVLQIFRHGHICTH